MTLPSNLSKCILPFIQQYSGQRCLLVGELAQMTSIMAQDTRSHALATPFTLKQLSELPPIDMAIVSDLVEKSAKVVALECLAALRNQYAQRILLLVNEQQNTHWQLTDYLGLGFKKRGEFDGYGVYSYAIEDYQFKKDWLNSRYWANPDRFDKHRW